MCEEISLCCQARMLPAPQIQIFPSSSLRHSHLWIPSPQQCWGKGLHGCSLCTALCSQESSPKLAGEQCQHCTASRSGTLPSPGRAGPEQEAFLLFSQLAAALSSRCFLSTALSVQRSAAEFHLGRKKFCESHCGFLS